MANKQDLLKEKLNALKPSIPTNTRGKAAKKVEPAAQPKPVVKTAPKAAPKTQPKIDSKGTIKAGPKATPKAAVKTKAKPETKVKAQPKPKTPLMPQLKPEVKVLQKQEPKPLPKINVQAPQREEKRFTFENTFIFTNLIHENMTSFGRMRDAMIEEIGNMNNLYVSNCRRCMGIYYETLKSNFGFLTPFPLNKWPFL